MEAYEGVIEEGDMIFTNDPYSCGGAVSHLNDYLVIKAVYKDGRHLYWAAHFGHDRYWRSSTGFITERSS